MLNSIPCLIILKYYRIQAVISFYCYWMKSCGKERSEAEKEEHRYQHVETVRLIYPILVTCLYKGKAEDMGLDLFFLRGGVG
jgi:hypothetical protein